MAKIKYSLVTAALVVSLGMSGCGDDNNDNTTSTLTGTFVDAPVAGIAYQSATQSGFTNQNGEFSYVAGEEVEFRLGNLVLGKGDGKSVVTPYDIAEDNTTAVNIALVLQNFDNNRSDGVLDLSNLADYNFTDINLSDANNVQSAVTTLLATADFQTLIDDTNTSLLDVDTVKATMNAEIETYIAGTETTITQTTEELTTALLDGKTVYFSALTGDGTLKFAISFTTSQISFEIKDTNNVVVATDSASYTIDNGIIKWTDGDGAQQLSPISITDKGFVLPKETTVANGIDPYNITFMYYNQSDADTAFTMTNQFTSEQIVGKTFYAYANIDNTVQTLTISFTDTQLNFNGTVIDYTLNNGVITFNDDVDGAQEWHLLVETDKGIVVPKETTVSNGINPSDILVWYYTEADRDAAILKASSL